MIIPNGGLCLLLWVDRNTWTSWCISRHSDPIHCSYNTSPSKCLSSGSKNSLAPAAGRSQSVVHGALLLLCSRGFGFGHPLAQCPCFRTVGTHWLECRSSFHVGRWTWSGPAYNCNKPDLLPRSPWVVSQSRPPGHPLVVLRGIALSPSDPAACQDVLSLAQRVARSFRWVISSCGDSPSFGRSLRNL